MANKMTFDKYIDNPSGGSSVITNRNMYKNMYKSKFDKVLLRENGKIQYILYKSDNNIDSHYIHFKIPSEVVSDFYYDVVIHLFTKNNMYKNSGTMRQYTVEFYSNDPAYVYTFAHSFYKNELFIKDLEPKMSQQALRHKASVRNPKDDVWYVKSLYFAYLAMERYNLFNKTIFDRESSKYDKKKLLNSIMQAEDKVKLRQELADKLAKEAHKQKDREDNKSNRNITNPSNTTKIVKTSKVAKTTTTSKNSNKTKIIGKKHR